LISEFEAAEQYRAEYVKQNRLEYQSQLLEQQAYIEQQKQQARAQEIEEARQLRVRAIMMQIRSGM
jgi:hypothetical protein